MNEMDDEKEKRANCKFSNLESFECMNECMNELILTLTVK